MIYVSNEALGFDELTSGDTWPNREDLLSELLTQLEDAYVRFPKRFTVAPSNFAELRYRCIELAEMISAYELVRDTPVNRPRDVVFGKQVTIDMEGLYGRRDDPA